LTSVTAPSDTARNVAEPVIESSRPLNPVLDMFFRRQEVSLLVVARLVTDHKVIDAIVRIAGPGDEVVHLDAGAEACVAAKAPVILQLHQRSAGDAEGTALGAEEKALPIRFRQPVHAGDLDCPLSMEKRTQNPVKACKVVGHVRKQQQPVVRI
jgi:hypothetical protein